MAQSGYRPDKKAALTSFVVTFVAIGAIFGLGGATRRGIEPTYSPRWATHSLKYTGCKDCHSGPFQRITDANCMPCHREYEESYNPLSLEVYPPDWIPGKDADPGARQKRKDNRRLAAHLLYHKFPEIKSQECIACHPEHVPPPMPDGWAFVHRTSRFVPRSINFAACSQCHGPNQAPPDDFHAELRRAGLEGRDCGTCHKNTDAWRADVIFQPLPGAPAMESALRRPADAQPQATQAPAAAPAAGPADDKGLE
jgi:hypothetical protein